MPSIKQLSSAWLATLQDPVGAGIKTGIARPLELVPELACYFGVESAVPHFIMKLGAAMTALKDGISAVEFSNFVAQGFQAVPQHARSYVIIVKRAKEFRAVAKIPAHDLQMQKAVIYAGFIYDVTETLNYLKRIGAVSLSQTSQNMIDLAASVSGAVVSVIALFQEAAFLNCTSICKQHDMEYRSQSRGGNLDTSREAASIAPEELVISALKIVAGLSGLALSILFAPYLLKGQHTGAKLCARAFLAGSLLAERVLVEMTVKKREPKSYDGALTNLLSISRLSI